MKNLYLLTIISLFYMNVFSQENSKIDSLKTLFEKEQNIKKKTKLFNLIGHEFEDQSNLDSALFYFNEAKKFAFENNYEIGVAQFDFHAIKILNKQGKFREALEVAEESADRFKKLKSYNNLGIAYLNLGNQWQYLSDFKKALEYYLKAKEILDSVGDQNNQRLINNNLGSVFLELEQYKKAEDYFHKAIELADNNYPSDMFFPLYNLAMSAKKQNKYDEALKYIEEYNNIAQNTEDHYYIIDGLLVKGTLLGKNNLNEGVFYLNSALKKTKEFNFPESEMYAYLYLAEIYIDHKNPLQALQNIQQGIPLAEKFEMKFELGDFHKKASEAYEELGDFEKALKFNRKHEELISEIQLEENKKQLIGLEAKYQFKQREAEIRSLNAEKQAQTLKIRQKNFLNFALAAILLATGIISFLAYKNYKNKQKLQTQRIHELETEKQLSATQALLQGQEDERSRMAKELHDGLGGLLSGVKLNLNNMQKKLIITEEDGAAFEKSIHLLDESINELRRVAHNMMPESIIKFGLDGAIREFLQSIQNEDLSIIYQSYHIENGLGKQLDISVYRIIQELVNNAIKHSGTSEILVQMRKDEGLLNLDVEDNGKGFDIKSVEKENGMGLAGIHSRVNYWKGKLEIDSSETGTAVHIEIPI